MADQKVSDLPALNGADVDAADLLYIVDSSAGSAGSKKITVGQYQLAPVSGGTANGVVYLNGSKVVTTGSGLVFDGSNLGLGVTPSAWGSGFRALQIYGRSSIASDNANRLWLNSDCYNNGTNWIYGASGVQVSQYQAWNGQHAWFNAPSGTAGNAISFTQAMTLDASGNLGVGTTSPAQRLDVVTTSATVAKFTRDLATDVSLTIGADTDGAILGTDGVNVMRMFTGGTERMRLDASGNIGLNGTSPSAWFGYKALQSDQSSLYEASNSVGLSSNSYFPSAGTSWTRISALATARYDITSGVHKWFADASGAAGGSFTPTERMQLDNSGNLLVGTGTVSGAGGLTYLNQGATGFAVINNNNAGATGYVFQSFRRSSTEIGSITQNGTTAVLFNTTSDRRLKDNIVPAPSASDVIDAIEIISHDWKAAPDEHVTYGVIAQDLALVAPQAVLQGDDGDEIGKTWGVDYSKLVPMLIKEIQSLRARVAALESA